MCVMSMVLDHYNEKFQQNPWIIQQPQMPMALPTEIFKIPNAIEQQQQIDELRKQVMELTELVKKAIEYDKKNNQPHCEDEEKLKLVRAVAKAVGVDFDTAIKGENK